MKKLIASAILALSVASLPAFAADRSENVKLSSALNVGSTHLSEGEYRVTWSGDGPQVQLTFTKGKTVAATVSATLKHEKHSYASVGTSTRPSGEALQSLNFKDVTLEVADTTTAGQ
jgi:hypothetical protein